MISGVDISVWNGAIDFPKMATKAQFVFIRAAYANFLDRKISWNWIQARNAGLVRGAYLYMTSTVNPVDQAATLYKALDGDLGELPPTLDLEESSLKVLSIQSCLQEIERLFGRKAIIYSGNWWMNTLPDKPTWFAEHPLWIAQWYNNWVPSMSPDVPKPWQDYTFWQYSNAGDGVDYGCEGRDIDLDIYHGTDEQWAALRSAGTAIPIRSLPITISEVV